MSSQLRVPVTEQDHSTGPENAPALLVEYGDYQCPYCGQAYPVVKELLKEFEGRVRFVFRNFPLAELHAEAVDAAFVAEFAAAHGRFWEAHDLLFENQQSLGPELYDRICEQLGFSPDDLSEAAKQRLYLSRIQADETGGIRSGVNGTPTFFINGVRLDEGTSALRDALASATGGR